MSTPGAPKSPLGWLYMAPNPGVALPPQLVPDQDFYDHFTEDCWCKPVVDAVGLLVHNSYDQRELIELGLRRIQ